MTIFRATRSDAELLATIISESNDDVAKKFDLTIDNSPKHPSFYTKEWVLSDFDRHEEYFIYRDENTCMGCVAFESPDPEVAYLNRLSVLPKYRQQGIGEKLVNSVFEYARSKEIPKVSIGIIDAHNDLKNWYLKLGFVDGEKKNFSHLPFVVRYMSYDLENPFS